MKTFTRQQFLQHTAMAGAALMLSSLEGFALTMPDKKIKVAVIGCGSVSGVYLPHLSKSPFVELVSVCDIVFSRAQKRAQLGKISSAHAHYGHLGPTWSAFFYEKGGGSLPDLGVYNIATLTGLLGPAKHVMAMTSIVTPERTVDDKGKIKVEAEDNTMLLMDHGEGVISHVQCGFNYFDPYGHEGKGQQNPTITIWGTKGNMGLIGYDWAPFGVDLATSFTEPPVRYVPDPGTYVWQQGASVIAESLITGKEPLIAAEHALHVLEVIEAARVSGDTGKKIQLQSVFKWPVV